MKVTGIIAEYNPFHKGHAYHIQKAKELTGADYIIVVMSGDFTQRGMPAILDKYTRARMALACGADLVLELPVRFACASAEFFAGGAVSLLDRLGVVDSLCFGSECGDAGLLQKAASVLAEAEALESFRSTLREGIRNGLSFPACLLYTSLFCQGMLCLCCILLRSCHCLAGFMSEQVPWINTILPSLENQR